MTGFTPIDPPANHAMRRRRAPGDGADAESCDRAPAVEPFKLFPVDVMPEPIRGFVTVSAKSMGCDHAYVALPLLSAIASVIGNTRRIGLKSGWSEPSVIWTAIVGESGTMKTPAFRGSMKPLRDLQRDEMRTYEHRCSEYDRATLHYEKALRKWKHQGKGDPPTKPNEPQPARLIVSDITVEALAPILQTNWRGLLMARDELGGWIASFDRYASGKGSDAAHWLSMFNAETLIVDRKTGPVRTLMVDRASVSVTGGIQPGTLRRAVGLEHRENGLLARLLLAWPPRKAKRWTDTGTPPEQEALLGLLFDRLRELGPNECEDRFEPVTVRLTAEAKAAWVEFYNTHAEEHADLTGDLSAAWSKLEGYAARLALVVHFVRWAAEDPTLSTPDAIDEASVASGITLSRWFGHEARRVYAMLSESDEDGDRRQLVELIRRKGGSVTPRELMRSSRQFPTAEAAELALEDLAGAGFGRLESVPPGPSGGRPTKRFRVVDAVDVDETPADDPTLSGCVNVNTVNAADDEGDPVAILAAADGLSPARDEAARLIRDARRGGDNGRAAALRDAWRERLASCTIDGELPQADAEAIALDELRSILAERQE